MPTIGLYTLAPKGPTNLKMVLLLHILHYMSGGLSICSSSTKETCGHMCKEPHMYVCVCENEDMYGTITRENYTYA